MDTVTRKLTTGILLFCLCAFQAGNAIGDGITSSQWQEDLDYLARTLRGKHKNAFHTVPEETFENEVASFRAAIPTMTRKQILVGLVRIAAMIGDGHTAVQPYDEFDVYPMKLFRYEDAWRVTGIGPEHAEVLGQRVIRIGDTSITDAARAVDVMTPQGENRYFVMGWNGYWLKNSQVLHELGVTASDKRASYTFQSDTGAESTVQFAAVSIERYNNVDWQSAFSPMPEFMQSHDEAIWFRSLADGSLYISFKSYPDRREIKKIAKQIRERIEADAIDKLIIDLRGNGGGNFKHGLHLIKEIRKTDIHKTGRVYTLTDRWTFSAAMSNAAHCRDQLGAILVGEPPGERPNGYAENHAFTLPHSGIPASCSSEYYEFQDEDTPILRMDHLIAPDFSALREGKDPVLEWVLAQ